MQKGKSQMNSLTRIQNPSFIFTFEGGSLFFFSVQHATGVRYLCIPGIRSASRRNPRASLEIKLVDPWGLAGDEGHQHKGGRCGGLAGRPVARDTHSLAPAVVATPDAIAPTTALPQA